MCVVPCAGGELTTCWPQTRDHKQICEQRSPLRFFSALAFQMFFTIRIPIGLIWAYHPLQASRQSLQSKACTCSFLDPVLSWQELEAIWSFLAVAVGRRCAQPFSPCRTLFGPRGKRRRRRRTAGLATRTIVCISGEDAEIMWSSCIDLYAVGLA